MNEYTLLCCVVNHGKGTKILKMAKKHGIRGGTVLMGKGTVKSKILELLDLNDMRKEIVIMVGETGTVLKAAEVISSEMAFHKQNHGIAFIIPLNNFIGTKNCEYSAPNKTEEKLTMYNAIFSIVDKGLAEKVIETANSAGARGGTIINARGSGIHETEMLFAMAIEPEKEIVIIIAKTTETEAITASIREKLRIDEPGNGIIFITPVSKTYGLI